MILAVAHLNIRPGISSCPASSSFLPSNARADLLTSASFTASKTALSPRTSQTPFEFRNTPCSSLTPCRNTPATYCSIRLFVFLLLSSLALFRFRFAFPAKLHCHEAVSSSFRKRRCVHLAQLTSLSPLLLCQHHTSPKTCVSKIFRSAIDVGTCSKVHVGQAYTRTLQPCSGPVPLVDAGAHGFCQTYREHVLRLRLANAESYMVWSLTCHSSCLYLHMRFVGLRLFKTSHRRHTSSCQYSQYCRCLDA